MSTHRLIFSRVQRDHVGITSTTSHPVGGNARYRVLARFPVSLHINAAVQVGQVLGIAIIKYRLVHITRVLVDYTKD